MIRKHFFINTKMQSKFIFTLLLIIFMISVIVSINMFFISNDFGNNVLTETEYTKIKSLIVTQLKLYKTKYISLLFVNIFIITVMGIFFSHQFAGPAYNINNKLKEYTNKDFSNKIILRDKDSLTEIADKLNFFVNTVNSDLTEIKKELALLDFKNKNEKELKSTLSNIEKVLSTYTLKNEIKLDKEDKI